jgi:hypothetical protein
MAKINIVGNVVNSTVINRYNTSDTSLTGTQIIDYQFDITTDYIEYIVYDIANNILNLSYLYSNYTVQSLNDDKTFSALDINPEEDLKLYQNAGEFNTQYNFFRNVIGDSINQNLFIKEISPDRTELKISSTIYNNNQLQQYADNLINEKNSSAYLKTHLLNFGNNNVYLVTNIALDKTNPTEYYILFKLYESLPFDINEKNSFWVVEEISNSLKFDIDLQSIITPDDLPILRGANFNIEIKERNTLPTQYQSYSSLLQFTGSSLQTILNNLEQTSININVDYTNFNNFVRFSSAEKRIENFYYKVKQIEDYNNFITSYSGSASTTLGLQTQIGTYSSSINEIVSKFDGFESYLYFQTSSITYPHINNLPPYTQQSTGSVSALAWYNGLITSASYYDRNNNDHLYYLIPEYIRIDNNNEPYITFIDMIGQYFDNIYIYLKSVTDLYKSYNNLTEGVSKDLVYYALQDLGVSIYNSNEDDNLSNYFVATSGSNIPTKDLVAELYKRIYHNIPLLFKGKGSRRGMQELVTTFGITGSILGIKEYGGDSNTHAALTDYSTDKVRVINEHIFSGSLYGSTGSVLSPLIKLATTNTYTNYKNDSDRIEIAFSPQNQIDKVISASVISSYPTFSIDDYIGDPRYAGSTEYGSLNNIRYQAITSSFTKPYDINGFIKLIKYFDNTLFKMLKSYTPAKANLTEGVTIRQQALERIKFKRNEHNATEQDVYDAEFNSPTITEDNSYMYDNLGGDKAPFYNGDIIGSYVNIGTEYSNQYNPYLQNTTQSVNFNQWAFNHSDYNVMLNNVSSSRLSVDRLRTEKQPLSTQSVLSPVELQDSYESLTSYRLSRHDGVKLQAKYLNIFTSASSTYVGDISYDNNSLLNYLDSCIYEVEWGGGGYPESENGGGIRLGYIYLVGETKDDVIKLAPGDPTYHNILEKNIPSLSTITYKQYNNSAAITNNITVAYSNIGLPNASYYIASNYVNPQYPTGVQYWGILYPTGSGGGIPYIDLGDAQSVNTPLSEINGNGFLQQSTNNIQNNYLLDALISGGTVIGTYDTRPKDRWFISFYSGSGVTSSLSTGLSLSTDGTPLEQYGNPFEIDYVSTSPGGDFIYLKDGPNNSVKYWFETGSTYRSGAAVIIGSYGSTSYTGALITKAEYPNPGLTIFGIPSFNFAGMGKGYILTPYPKDVIKQNVDYITKTYGSNSSN